MRPASRDRDQSRDRKGAVPPHAPDNHAKQPMAAAPQTLSVAPRASRGRSPHNALPCAILACAAFAAPLAAQTSAPAPVALPDDVAGAVRALEDDAFDFDRHGFYELLAFVDALEQPLAGGLPVDDWRALLERSNDFRGVAVEIEGVVGRVKGWRPLRPEWSAIGPVWQLELSRRDQPIACTVVLTEPSDDVPIGARIRVTAIFAMIRQYYGPSNRPQRAALLVGQAPSEVITRGPASARSDGPRLFVIGGIGVVLLLIWWILRRRVGSSPQQGEVLRAEHAAPFSVAEEAQAWAQREQVSADADADAAESDVSGESPP